MEPPRAAHWTRRHLLGRGAGLAAVAAVAPSLARLMHDAPSVRAAAAGPQPSFTHALAPTAPLIDRVTAVCQRLAPAGWRTLLLKASSGGLDLAATDLATALATPLATIDRAVPGFEDFALDGRRGIEPGSPARSLLFHALASPNVFDDGSGAVLGAFPTPADLEAVENYVYGVQPPSLDEVRQRANGNPLAVVVFALEYRVGRETVHSKHADFCFARTGHARMGTTAATYDARRREFLPGNADDPFAFPVQPVRYAPFLAALRPSDPDVFGPLRATDDDRSRRFWAPLHKLFSGPECLRGLDLHVALSTGHINEKLRRFHLRLNNAGFDTGWAEPEIEQFPFVIRDEALASLASEPDYGSGWVMPQPHPLVAPADYDGAPLTFFYSPGLASSPRTIYFSSLQLLENPPFEPLGPGRTQALPENVRAFGEAIPGYRTAIGPDIGRSAPEYLNVRHEVTPDGADVDLNAAPDVMTPIKQGGYWARHYVDYTADGWVAARCPELDEAIPARVAAYSTVCPPSFYPYANQRALTEWAERDAPPALRDGLWAIPPRPLSDRRLAANITLPAGFTIDDDTVTAIVSLPTDAAIQPSGQPATQVRRPLHLPDAAAGLFDPGWEVSQDRTADNRFFLASYGLGTPFIEDAKLCATLSTFWPGVSPDTAREFQPNKLVEGTTQAWPTIAPMTDEELGIIPANGHDVLPWDGVRGPRLVQVAGADVVEFPEILHTDYLDTVDRFTAALTSKVDQEAYVARVLAMAQVYWALGIRYADYRGNYALAEALDRFQAAKGEWTVLSYRILGASADPDLVQAHDVTGTTLQGSARHRFQLFRWNGKETPTDDVQRVNVGIAEQVIAYTDLQNVLIQRGGAWTHVVPPR